MCVIKPFTFVTGRQPMYITKNIKLPPLGISKTLKSIKRKLYLFQNSIFISLSHEHYSLFQFDKSENIHLKTAIYHNFPPSEHTCLKSTGEVNLQTKE